MGGAYNVLAFGTPEQIERYLKPTLAGKRADSYAVTEGGAGSDAGGIAGTAERTAAAGASGPRSGSSRRATWRTSTS